METDNTFLNPLPEAIIVKRRRKQLTTYYLGMHYGNHKSHPWWSHEKRVLKEAREILRSYRVAQNLFKQAVSTPNPLLSLLPKSDQWEGALLPIPSVTIPVGLVSTNPDIAFDAEGLPDEFRQRALGSPESSNQ